MIAILKRSHGMNIVGQGGKIILFMLPALVAALLLHLYLPGIAALPAALQWVRPVGYVLLVFGLALWGTAVVQLLTLFPQGKLITTGAYGVVRNPIYSSVALLILPAVTLVTLTWVYLVVSIFLFAGVQIFIGVEERKLLEVFGTDYEVYLSRVDRLIPFKKP